MAVKRKPQAPPVFDRVPPQNIEAERSVLGAIMLNPDAIGTAIEILHDSPEEMFYVEAHQHIYSAMITLLRRNVPVDAVTLLSQLDQTNALDKCGGPSYVAELTSAVPTSANIEYYAKLVLDSAVLRKLITVCTQVTSRAYEKSDEVNTLLDAAESEIFSIAQARQLNPIHRVADLLTDAINGIERVIRSHQGYTGLPTGYHKLDEMLSGFQASDMIILAARPSVGKTAFALNVASNVAIREKKSVLLFSLEMAKEQLVQRLLCMIGKIDSKRLRSGFLAGEEFKKIIPAADKLSTANIYIDETPNISVLELRSKARRHAAQHGVDLIVIDYLQLMTSGTRVESRQLEISEISRSIKGIARELNVPVLALSQLSREAEKDDTGSPKLSHLRESGAIEQDADVVMMLSRPPVDKRGEEEDTPTNHDKLVHLTIAKQRNGPTGRVDLFFDRNIQQFQDPDFSGMAPPPGMAPSNGGSIGSSGVPAYDPEEVFDDEDDTPF